MMNILRVGVLAVAVIWVAGCSDPEIEQGELVYNKFCKVCHAQGINGAPVLGNQKNWAPRKQQEFDVLVQHATEGFGLMPANSGRAGLADEDIPKAIKYMLSQLED